MFVKPTILIIDEMGYLKLDPNGAHYLFQAIVRRYEQGPIILTSNKSFGEWGEVMGDSVLATAMLDRLLHHSIIFNLKGKLSITGKKTPTRRKTEGSIKSFWGILNRRFWGKNNRP